MSVDLPLDSMTTSEKLQLMESIWDSLRTIPDLPAPDWHREVLAERTRQIEAGEVEFSDWEDVKKRLDELGEN
jgi:putative addiction module component (TIGR02574 family)